MHAEIAKGFERLEEPVQTQLRALAARTPSYHGTFFNFCTRKSENTLTLGARCLLLP